VRSSLSPSLLPYLRRKSESESGVRDVLPRTSTTTLQDPKLSTTRTTNGLFNTSSFFSRTFIQDQTIFLSRNSQVFLPSIQQPRRPLWAFTLIPAGNLRCYSYTTKQVLWKHHYTKQSMDKGNIDERSSPTTAATTKEDGTGSRRFIWRSHLSIPASQLLVTHTALAIIT
jgi:hypothetical protein